MGIFEKYGIDKKVYDKYVRDHINPKYWGEYNLDPENEETEDQEENQPE